MATGSILFIPQRDKGKSSVTLSPRWLRPLTPPNCHAGLDPASLFSFLIMYIFH